MLLSFFSDFIILPGYIDFTADEVVSYFQIFSIRVESLAVTSLWYKVEPVWTQGGELRISNGGMIEWGQKSNPKKSLDQKLAPKISHANFPCLKNFQKVLNDITRKTKFFKTKHFHESSDCFEYLKRFLLKSSHPKNTSENFVLKKSGTQKFQAPKNPWVIPVAWDLECPPG